MVHFCRPSLSHPGNTIEFAYALPHRRLPSNSCIERAPHDLLNLPAFLEWGASDTALAFLDNFRVAH